MASAFSQFFAPSRRACDESCAPRELCQCGLGEPRAPEVLRGAWLDAATLAAVAAPTLTLLSLSGVERPGADLVAALRPCRALTALEVHWPRVSNSYSREFELDVLLPLNFQIPFKL